jgi:hypothetical protein
MFNLVHGMYCPGPIEHGDRGFEYHSRHRYMPAVSCIAFLPVWGVVPDIYRIDSQSGR